MQNKTKEILIKIIPFKLLRFFNKFFTQKKNTIFIQNINSNPNNPNQERVLFSYVFDHLYGSSDESKMGTRALECSIIIHELIRKDYCVDLIDCGDDLYKSSLSNKNYDLVFGFGKPFNYVVKKGNARKRVIYLTERYPAFSIKKEKERIDYFKQRHNKKAFFSRSNLYYKEEDFINLDSIVYIGNPSDEDLIPVNVQKFSIKPTGLLNLNYQQDQRNIPKSKKNFIWFGSRGAIHKGLDLLIDVFKEEKDCTLYIGGLSKLDKKILPNFEKSINIIDLGFVDVCSDRFVSIVNQCSFVIFPSCSEGISTGVITCMNHGLIPVVSKETGIQTQKFGIQLNDFKIDTITKSVRDVSNYSNEIIMEQHKLVYEYASENFSLLNFQETFSDILTKL